MNIGFLGRYANVINMVIFSLPASFLIYKLDVIFPEYTLRNLLCIVAFEIIFSALLYSLFRYLRRNSIVSRKLEGFLKNSFAMWCYLSVMNMFYLLSFIYT